MGKLMDKNILITGGDSGIGLAAAQEFDREGARKGWPTTSIVSSCKAAVAHLARILSAELVERGIRVNTLSPGPTDTAMFGRFAGEERGNAVKEVLGTNNPSKRIADPKEIAKLAVYLASDDSRYIVGADFLIGGGVP